MHGISEETQINYIWKKLTNKQNTSNLKKWYEEADGKLINSHKTEIWIDDIPTEPTIEYKNILTELNDIEMIYDKTVGGKLAWHAFDNDNNKIVGLIPPSYGNKYNVTLKINGEVIPSSHPIGWYFDYVNGILKFEKTPPAGSITISGYQYTGYTFAQYLTLEENSVARGVIGIDKPQINYIIQHNMNSYDIDAIIYVWDEIDGIGFWKKDVLPLILLDENRIQIQLTEEQPLRFIIKSY